MTLQFIAIGWCASLIAAFSVAHTKLVIDGKRISDSLRVMQALNVVTCIISIMALISQE